MDQPKPLIATHKWNPLKEAVGGLESKLAEIRVVLERAGWNGWIEREDDEVWSWLQNVSLLEGEVRAELKNLQPGIDQAVGGNPVLAVKVLYSFPSVRSCINRLKVQDRILLKIKELSGKIESGFKDDDVMKFNKLSYPDSESADRIKPPLTTSDLRVLPVRSQISRRDKLLTYYFFPNSSNNYEDQRIFTIGGLEGSGKTTLAQMLYNHNRVLDHFEIRKWVCVENYFNDRSIKRIRRELGESEEDIKRDLRYGARSHFAGGKRFLLVLDHVYDSVGEEASQICSSLLKSGAHGSLIILTSRFFLRSRNYQSVGILSTSDCWSILKRAALSGKPQLYREVRNIGRKFAEKCRGSPLAARTMGDYLKPKATAQEWEDALGDDGQLGKMLMKVLLSERKDAIKPGFLELYDMLSPNLKECLSYCNVFPKDYLINVESFVALWEAMGYIGNTDTCMEKRDYDAIEKLLEMWLFTNLRRSVHNNKITSCKFRKEYYVSAKHTFPELTIPEQQKKLDSDTQSLQSFVIVSHCQLPKDIFRILKYVKALVLSCCELDQLSGGIGSLDLLQFLDLSGNPLERLPESIGDLRRLESLYLHSCYLLLALPQRIGDLEHLRNLRINYTTDMLHNLPKRFEELTSIKTLDTFKVGGSYDNIGKLKNLNDLVDIRIVVHGKVCFSDADLQSKGELKNLELCFVGKGRDQEMEPSVNELVPPPNLEMILIENYRGFKLPLWMLVEDCISKLKRLSLKSNVNISSLPALWKLSSLEFLWLYDMPKITHLGCELVGVPKIQQMMSTDDEYYSDDEDVKNGHGAREEEVAFRSLRTLRIECMKNWAKWEDVDEHYVKLIKVMPSLEELIIADCPKLQGRPLRMLRDTPWFKKTYGYYEGIHTWNGSLAVHIGGEHDSNFQNLKDLNDWYHIHIDIHGNIPFLGANLQKKTKVKYLELCFVGKGCDREISQSIEELEPPPNIEVLMMDDYPGLRLPNWILVDSMVNKLERLSVRSASNISSFTSLWKLSSLRFLWLFDIPSIKCLGLEFFGRSKTGQPEDGKTAFPELISLQIQYMQNWETWEDIDVVESDQKRIKVMPCLASLEIIDCPKLQGKPLRILRDTPWFRKHHKPSTSEGKEIEIEHPGETLPRMNEQNNDNPSTSKGKENEIEHQRQQSSHQRQSWYFKGDELPLA